MLRAMQRSSK